VFHSRAIQILNPQDGGVLIVSGQHLKPIATNDSEPSLIEFINLVDPIYYD